MTDNQHPNPTIMNFSMVGADRRHSDNTNIITGKSKWKGKKRDISKDSSEKNESK